MSRIHPSALKAGARVAVTCPASPVAQAEKITRGAARLRAMGFEVVLGKSCGVREGLWAGPDAERAAEMIDFLNDPDIDAIFAARGGVGCLRLLPFMAELPGDAAPKWIIGRSDLTAIHVYFWGRRGWIGLSGPMVATDLGDDPAASVIEETRRILFGLESPGRVGDAALEAWRDGSAEGYLLPANLSLLCSMVGTPFLPSLAGAILVLEEIEEPPHRCDRMLTQLRLSGALSSLAGLVFGQFTDCKPREGDAAIGSLDLMLRGHADAIGVPTLAGLQYGHERNFHPLAVGVRARIEHDPPSLILLEGGPPPS